MMLRLLKHLMALSMLITASLSHAELTIDILKANNNAMPIAVVPFGSDTATEPLNRIISDDLARSGLFKPAQSFPEQPTKSAEVVFGVWQGLGLDFRLKSNVFIFFIKQSCFIIKGFSNKFKFFIIYFLSMVN